MNWKTKIATWTCILQIHKPTFLSSVLCAFSGLLMSLITSIADPLLDNGFLLWPPPALSSSLGNSLLFATWVKVVHKELAYLEECFNAINYADHYAFSRGKAPGRIGLPIYKLIPWICFLIIYRNYYCKEATCLTFTSDWLRCYSLWVQTQIE